MPNTQMATRESIIEDFHRIVKSDPTKYEDNVRRRCRILAELAHDGQTRSNGEDYIRHVYGVASLLQRCMVNINIGYNSEDSRSHSVVDVAKAASWELDEVIALACLHDVVEDTALTMDDVEGLVSGEFLYPECLRPRLESLTTVIPEGIRDRSIKVAIQENKAMKMTEQAALVKMADRIHNLTDALDDWEYRRVVRYVLESENMMEILFGRFDRFGSWQLTVAARLRERYLSIRDEIIQTDYDEFCKIRRELYPA